MKKEKLRFIPLSILLLNACYINSLQAQQTETKDSVKDSIVAVAPSLAPSTEDIDLIFMKTEVEASVDMGEWRSHLEKYLVPVIDSAARSGIKAGKYVVYVRFLVEKNGSISDVRALNNISYGLSLGAVNVVKTGPKWKPAEQNKRKVRSYHTQPITFVITDK
jgi:protein TonB